MVKRTLPRDPVIFASHLNCRPVFGRIVFMLPAPSTTGTNGRFPGSGARWCLAPPSICRPVNATSFRYLIDGRWQTDYHADNFTETTLRQPQQHGRSQSARTASVADRQPNKVIEAQPHISPHLPSQGRCRAWHQRRTFTGRHAAHASARCCSLSSGYPTAEQNPRPSDVV